ncbi:MAG: hypothetical protein LQ341_002002 [Variospora aurantia]|nr:MAG: hypothetical protein LQ341_002002 [Variospora aurantia]
MDMERSRTKDQALGASRIIADIRNLFTNHSAPSETDSTHSESSNPNSTRVSVQASKAQQRPIVRLPPSRSRVIDYRASSPMGPWRQRPQGVPTPCDFKGNLMEERKVLVAPQSKDSFTGCDTSRPADDSSPDDTASSEATGNRELNASENPPSRKKTRRRTRKQVARSKRAKLAAETGGGADQAQRLTAAGAAPSPNLAPPASPTTTTGFPPALAATSSPPALASAPAIKIAPALLLQNARRNWENVCHLLMGQVCAEDRQIITQIASLVRRLGNDSRNDFSPDGSADQIESTKLQTWSSTLPNLMDEDHIHGDCDEETPSSFEAALDWLTDSQNSSYPVLEPQPHYQTYDSRLVNDTAPNTIMDNKPQSPVGETDREWRARLERITSVLGGGTPRAGYKTLRER